MCIQMTSMFLQPISLSLQAFFRTRTLFNNIELTDNE